MIKRKVKCIVTEGNIIIISDFRQNIICYYNKDIFYRKVSL